MNENIIIKDDELLHHLECLHYKLKYRIFMVDSEYEFMSIVLKKVIELIKEKKL